MKKQKILILGGTGFIGRNLWERFAQDPAYEVSATYRGEAPPAGPLSERVKFLKANLTAAGEVSAVVKGMDIVLQAAATTSGAKDIIEKPYLHVTDNAVINALLFKACFEEKVKHVVYFSCTNVYMPQKTPVTEEDFKGEVYDKYFGGGWTKVYNEKMCEFYSRISGTKYTVIRHSNIYGPYDKFDLEKSHVFGATITKVMNAANGKVTVWGDGSEERDLLYVDDLLDFVAIVLQKQECKFELVNLGAEETVSIKELVHRVIRHSGRDLKVEYDPAKPSIGFSLKINCGKAKSRYAWSPKISLDEGIRKTLSWYADHYQKRQTPVKL